MAPVQYAGALQPKKKSELQEIATALRLSDQGTKEELQARIKKHLDSHSALEEDPRFAGLYGRRKRTGSVQPQLAPPQSTRAEKPRSSNRVAGLDPIRETTPVKELRDVSSFLKHPLSPVLSTPQKSPQQDVDLTTPSSLPPLPPSPAKSIIEHLPKPADVRAVVQRLHTHELLPHGTEFLEATRTFLSNSRNIWTVTALFELLTIIYTVVPWKYAQLPLSAKGETTLSLPYPPASVFQTSTFWLVLLHWAIPTLVLPSFVGNLISFNPPQQQQEPSHPVIPFDPLTAAIARLAVSMAYPYATFSATEHVHGLDVLGVNLRVFNAGVGMAFALAEAIQGAPRLFAKTLVQEHRLALVPASASHRTASQVRALTAAGEEESSEVD